MITETYAAALIQDEDFIVVKGEVYQVTSIDDTGDALKFDVRDEDGEVADLPPFGAFDAIEVVMIFDDEKVDIPDIE